MRHNHIVCILFVAALFCAAMAHANNKVTPSARLSLLQKQTANSSKKINEQTAIRLVVEVDANDAAGTFAQIREIGGIVQSKLGHQAVISIPTDKVEALADIEGILTVDAPRKGELKTITTREETGVSQIDGTMPGTDMAYTGQGITICVVDAGFDFQHTAFKDADGNTRLRCVYLPNNDSGHKFVVEDEEAGTIEFPGSVFDTPELIATLTTDEETVPHGTHTVGIAAGSRSPQGYGGMAPEADLVLVSMAGEDNVVEIALQFTAQYARQIDGPVVISASMNSQKGPHDGTGTMPRLVNEISNYAIPVFAVGNDGVSPVHIYHAFDEENNSMKALLAQPMPSLGDDDPRFTMGSLVYGYSRNTLHENEALNIQLGIADKENGNILWQSEPCAISLTEDGRIEITSDSDEGLGQYLEEGIAAIYGGGDEDGQLGFLTAAQGMLTQDVYFFISLSSSSPIEVDMWEATNGFARKEMEGFTPADSELSCGDWTSTPNVISVGNYVVNTSSINYTGVEFDLSELYTKYDIEETSSYGISLNGVAQPVVAAPGTNVVSSFNHYSCFLEIAESMQWQGYPYASMGGTSMSCPVVSGIVALWLQADPTLTLDDIKEILAHTSRNDEFTTANPIRWGYGKIDAAAGIAYINGTTSITDIAVEELQPLGNDLWYDITGRTYHAKPAAPGIYIHAGKKYIIR